MVGPLRRGPKVGILTAAEVIAGGGGAGGGRNGQRGELGERDEDVDEGDREENLERSALVDGGGRGRRIELGFLHNETLTLTLD